MNEGCPIVHVYLYFHPLLSFDPCINSNFIIEGTIYSWDMQNFDGLFILSHKHKIIAQNFTEAFLNEISTLSENIKFFDQEMVRSGNDRILMQKIE